jgi:hypothetical protein
VSAVPTVQEARARFVALAESIGSTALDEETAILSVGREFLPPCALAVLDDSDAATVEYYEWLTEQTREALAAMLDHVRKTKKEKL